MLQPCAAKAQPIGARDWKEKGKSFAKPNHRRERLGYIKETYTAFFSPC
jgi:hypothetical protein